MILLNLVLVSNLLLAPVVAQQANASVPGEMRDNFDGTGNLDRASTGTLDIPFCQYIDYVLWEGDASNTQTTITLDVMDGAHYLGVGALSDDMNSFPKGVTLSVTDPQGASYGRNHEGGIYARGLPDIEAITETLSAIDGNLMVGEEHGVETIWAANPMPGQWVVEVNAEPNVKPFTVSALVRQPVPVHRTDWAPSVTADGSPGTQGFSSCDICKGAVIAIVIVAAVVIIALAAAEGIAAAAAYLVTKLIVIGVPVGIATSIGNFAVKKFLDGVIDGAEALGEWIAGGACSLMGLCTDETPPLVILENPSPGMTYAGMVFVSATAGDDTGNVEFVEFQYSTDGGSWSKLISPDDASGLNDGKDYYGPNGWGLRLDTNAADLVFDDTVWVRARAQDAAGNMSLWDQINGPFAVDNRTPGPTSLTVQGSLDPSASPPHGVVNVQGSAHYNTGDPVHPGTVTVTIQGFNTWTGSTNASGAFAVQIEAPESSQNVEIEASDGTLSDSVTRTISVTAPQSGSGYTFARSTTAEGVQGSDPFDPIDETISFSQADDKAYAWLQLDHLEAPVRDKFEWYRPDGALDFTHTGGWTDDPQDSGWEFWKWWKFWADINLKNTPRADMEGTWQVRIFVDSGGGYKHISTIPFVIRYDFTENRMAKDVQSQSPFMPINETNVFTTADSQALTWMNLNTVSTNLDVRWEYYEPNGALHTAFDDAVPHPSSQGRDHWGYYRIAGWMHINGQPSSSKTGDWQVKVYIKDYQGNWDNEYTDHFEIVESPIIPPETSTTLDPTSPLEGNSIRLNVNATDNGYLEKVVLNWAINGTPHSQEWSNILANTFSKSHDIGPHSELDQVTYYSVAYDTSGGSIEGIHDTIIIGDSDTEGPVISNILVSEHGGNGNGIIESNEQIRISWDLSDSSGIRATSLTVNDESVDLGGDYFAVFGPLSAGECPFRIIAEDNDNSPAVSLLDQTFNVFSGADLTVETTGLPDPVIAGNVLAYTIRISNNGPLDANGVVVSDNLPAGLSLNSVANGCNETNGIVTCELGTLPKGTEAVISIDVKVPQDIAQGTSLVNEVTASATEVDPNPVDNTSVTNTAVTTNADIKVDKTDDLDPIDIGHNLTYSMIVINNGPSKATNVSLVDDLPSGVDYLSSTPSQGSCNETGGTVDCNLGSLLVGQQAIVEILTLTSATGTVTNTVQVSADPTDPNEANNTSTVDTTVTAKVTLSISIFGNGSVQLGPP